MKITKAILFSVFILAIVAFGVSYFFFQGYPSGDGYEASYVFSEGWTYFSTDDPEIKETSLPDRLLISNKAGQVNLFNVLPDSITNKEYLYMNVGFQEGTILIDGEVRTHYGDADSSAFEYPFKNSSSCLVVPLEKEDSGKSVEIILRSPATLGGDLSRISSVMIGDGRALIIGSLFDADGNIIIFLINICFLIIFICMFPAIDKGIRNRLSFFIITMFAWNLFFVTASQFLGFWFGFSEKYGAMSDAMYYILDQMLPVINLATITILLSIRNKLHLKILYLGNFILLFVSILLHLLRIQSVNIWRPLLMAYFFILFLLVLKTFLGVAKTSSFKGFVIILIIIQAAYYVDYIRYAMTGIPIDSPVFSFLTVGLPSGFCLMISLFAALPLMMYSLMGLLRQDRMELLGKLNKDSLTNAFSRSALFEDLVVFMNDMDGKWDFGILDIDDFKLINDRYGHLQGDQILCIIADIIMKNIPNGNLYRFGGDEFCFVIRRTSIDVYKDYFAKFNRELSFRTRQFLSREVTVSVGMSSIIHNTSVSSIIGIADHSLYISKRTKNTLSFEFTKDSNA